MLERDMYLVKIIKDVKQLTMLSKCQNLLDDNRREQLRHTKDNVIDLDSDTDYNDGVLEMKNQATRPD